MADQSVKDGELLKNNMDQTEKKDDKKVTEIQSKTAPPPATSGGVSQLAEVVLILFFPTLILSQLFISFYLQYRVSEMFTVSNNTDQNYLLQKKVHQHVSTWQMKLLSTESFLSTFSGLIIGQLTDTYGRKLGMLLALSGTIIKFICITLTVWAHLPLSVLLLGVICSGLTGGAGGTISSCLSYIADITPPGMKRTIRLTIAMDSSLAISGILAYFYGHVIRIYGFFWASSALLSLAITDILFVLFILNESLKEKVTWKFSKLLNPVMIYVKETPKKRRLVLIILLLINFLGNSTNMGRASVLNQFLMNKPMSWDAVNLGKFLTVTSVGLSLATIPLIKFCKTYLSNTVTVILGLLSGIGSNILLSLANTGSDIYKAMAVGIGVNMAPALSQGLMSENVEPWEQGSLFASITCATTLGMVVFPILFNSVYSATVLSNPGIVFQVVACLLAAAIILQLLLFVIKKTSEQKKEDRVKTE